MKKVALTATVLLTLMCSVFPAYADRQLPPEEIKSLVSGKTIDSTHLKSGSQNVVYAATDGTLSIVYPGGRRVSGKWFLNDAGQHCVELPNVSACAEIIEKGDGKYDRVTDGVTSHTWENVREGEHR